LLLGLKGTMSEAELHLLKMRMGEGRMRQVERGELRQGLPTGLVRLPNHQVVKDPDDQVRHTIELVFSKFEEQGSCRKVLAYLRKNKISLPRRQTYGPQLSEIVWKPASQALLYLEKPIVIRDGSSQGGKTPEWYVVLWKTGSMSIKTSTRPTSLGSNS
jgi:DNA invertase Pin-like site-specific DNA recombinase